MKARWRTPLALIVLGIALGGCDSATDSDGAAAAAERLYAAYAADDGQRACDALSEPTRAQLAQDAEAPCPEAVLELDLSPGRAVATSAYVTEAKVDIEGGDSAFVEETPAGWRVTAAGCRPVPDQEAPYDCELES